MSLTKLIHCHQFLLSMMLRKPKRVEINETVAAETFSTVEFAYQRTTPCQERVSTRKPELPVHRFQVQLQWRRVELHSTMDLYKARHVIENFFAKPKQFRAIATRYENTARNFLEAIYFPAVLIGLG